MLVGQLRKELAKRGADTKGLKDVLVMRLQRAIKGIGTPAPVAAPAAAAAAAAAPVGPPGPLEAGVRAAETDDTARQSCAHQRAARVGPPRLRPQGCAVPTAARGERMRRWL